MTISKRLRFEILRRDNYTCRYCGHAAPEVKLTVDHLTPVALGGREEPGNLVSACVDCNSGKTSIAPDNHLVSEISDKAIAWAEAIRIAAGKASADRRKLDKAVARLQKVWQTTGLPQTGSNPAETLEQFLIRGLSVGAIERFMTVAVQQSTVGWRKSWNYFCGCCWRAITDIENEAQRLIERGTE